MRIRPDSEPLKAGDIHLVYPKAIEREKGATLSINDIMEHVAGVYPKVMNDGDLDAGAWSCGMVAGLIHDVPTCQALIDRIMLQAEQLIRQRLALSLN